MFKKWSQKPWYSLTVAGCLIVLLCVILINLPHVLSGIRTFLGFFTPVFIGIIIAYMINQLCLFYQAKLFRGVKNDTHRYLLGVFLGVITVIGCIAGAIVLVVPQLVDSVTTFANNLKSYEKAFMVFIQNWNFLSDNATKRIMDFLESSGGLLEYISNYTVDHLSSIMPALARTGRSVLLWIISFILAVYFLASKQMLKAGLIRLLHALFTEKKYKEVRYFMHRCNRIIATFLVYNILDALIVGLANAAFMLIAGMNYIGLISFVVGITNLVPTFGPIVGGAIGALLLILINPWHALAFLIFTVALQTCDGYIIKPRLFGNVLGVPGLWVLIAVVVFGRAFGVIGILLAIPLVAILDFIYKEYFMPWLERRHEKKEAELALKEALHSDYTEEIRAVPKADTPDPAVDTPAASEEALPAGPAADSSFDSGERLLNESNHKHTEEE